MIYFAHALGTDLVKIGFTAGDPLKRLKELQTGSPQSLELLGGAEGGEADEVAWHRNFAADRVNGEWFRLSPPLMVAIIKATRSLASDTPKKPRKRAKLFALTCDQNGRPQYAGIVVQETEASVRIECMDCFGFLRGELVDVPRASVRIFNDRNCFNHAICQEFARLDELRNRELLASNSSTEAR